MIVKAQAAYPALCGFKTNADSTLVRLISVSGRRRRSFAAFAASATLKLSRVG